MEKKVSVIIPNYNYARFLKRRIDSIVNQTVKPAEIIFLDDCSTDNSIEVARELLSKIDIPYQIIVNDTNQGVFKQWLKGIELIQHDYFWIAEADDYCELNFLETLLPAFDDKDVVISYCQSLRISEKGIENTHKNWLSTIIDAHRWNHDYTNICEDEAKNYLVCISSIANASAVVIRRNSVDKLWSMQISGYKMAGDWFFYLLLLFNNPKRKISYKAAVLNYWFQHQSSVWGDKNKEILGARECLSIFSFCLSMYDIPMPSKLEIFKLLNAYYLNINESSSLYLHQVLECILLLGEETYPQQLKDFVINRYKTNGEVNQLQIECQNRDAELSRLHQECANRDNEISRLHQECANRDNEISWLNQEIAKQDNETTSLHSEINFLKEEIHRLNVQIGSIYRTLSWKITKPLRLIKMTFIRVISHAK